MRKKKKEAEKKRKLNGVGQAASFMHTTMFRCLVCIVITVYDTCFTEYFFGKSCIRHNITYPKIQALQPRPSVVKSV